MNGFGGIAVLCGVALLFTPASWLMALGTLAFGVLLMWIGALRRNGTL